MQVPPPPPSRPARKQRRPWRDNLEAFGVAILAAVLLKPMVIEAYQIPTSSMQPTLMGSPEAGVYDRILVDKLCFELFEPERWDNVVFRYPIRRSQNYVKRIAGMPGDRLRIAAGNLWHVGADGDIDHVLRKPDRIQAGQWKEVFPARRRLDDPEGKRPIHRSYFEGAIGTWREEGEDLVVQPTASGRARLAYTDLDHRGLSDQIYDGYAPDIAAAIRSKASDGGSRGVPDARLSVTLTPAATLEAVAIELALQPAGHLPRAFRLEVGAAHGRLRITARRGTEVEELAASAPFPCELPPGTATALGFAHVDDRLVAWRNGALVGELEVGALRVVQDLEPGQVALTLETQGGGELRLSDLNVARDLHYVTSGLDDDLANLVPEGRQRALQNHVIEIPPGHYLMLGDNTLASADSRQWLVLSVGMSADGWLVDPQRRGDEPGTRVKRGNFRPWGLEKRPDNDENPVIVRARDPQQADRMAFTDDNGEVFALKARLGTGYAPTRDGVRFKDPGGHDEWMPATAHVYFVPREHIIGRPVLCFWPLFSPFRLGFIR